MGDLAKLLQGAAGGVQSAVGATGFQGTGMQPSGVAPVAPPDAGSLLSTLPGVQSAGMGETAAVPMSDGGMSLASLLPGMAETAGQTEPISNEPIDNPAAPDTPEELYERDLYGEDVDVQGDTWQPKKQDALSLVGDLLFGRGIFRERIKNRNIREAMQGWQRDPETAARRLRKVDADAALKFEESVSRTQGNRALEAKRTADTMARTGGVISNMLGVIEESNNPTEAYRQLRPALETYARHGNYPEDMLPQEWDPVKVGALRKSGLSVYQQEALDRMERSLQDQITHRREQRQSLDTHRREQRAEQARVNNSLIANRQSEMSVREAREARLSVGKGQEQFIYSKDRGGVVGSLSPDGRRAKIKGNGETHLFILEKPGDINSRRYVGKEVVGDDGKPKIIYGTEQ